MGLQKQRERLAASFDLLQRKDRFLRAAVLELGQLALDLRCAFADECVAVCDCRKCMVFRSRLEVFAAGMQALLDEEAALVARFGGRPVLPLTRH